MLAPEATFRPAHLFGLAVRVASHLSYTPLLAVAATISLVKIVIYARLLPIVEFGIASQMLLLSGFFSLFGNLGTQLIAARDAPVLFQREQPREAVAVLARSVLVTVAVGLLCLALGVLGARPFELSRLAVALAVIHGLLVQIFTTVVIETRSRLAMMRYAREVTARAALMILAGVGAAWAGWGGEGVIAGEIAATLVVLPSLTWNILKRAHVSLGELVVALRTMGADVPWRPSLILLAGSLISFLSFNLDRWIAAFVLDRREFAQYSFAWIAALTAQSLQFLLNAGIFPLLARRTMNETLAAGLRLAGAISIATLCLGFLGAVVAVVLVPPIVNAWLPQYDSAITLMLPLVAAAIFRVSDFWASYLITSHHEMRMLTVQATAIVAVTMLWFPIAAASGFAQIGLSLAWLAFALAAITHVSNAIAAWLVLRQ